MPDEVSIVSLAWREIRVRVEPDAGKDNTCKLTIGNYTLYLRRAQLAMIAHVCREFLDEGSADHGDDTSDGAGAPIHVTGYARRLISDERRRDDLIGRIVEVEP